MEAQRIVERGNNRRWQLPDTSSEAPNVYGSDLFRLGFGRACQAGGARLEQCLEREYVCDVRCHRHNAHHAMAESLRTGIRPIVAHNDHRAPLVGLRGAYRLEVCNANLAAPHERGSASAAVGSHNSASPDCSHSCQASS